MDSQLIKCFELDLKKDIPAELNFYKSHCQALVNRNLVYKKVLLGASAGICLFIIYKTLHHYASKKKSTERSHSK